MANSATKTNTLYKYISGENSSKILYGTSLSDDIVTDGSTAQVAYGMSGGDTLSAMPNRSGVGTSAADTLYGGEGNDVLSGSGGNDIAAYLGEYKNFSVEPGFASEVFYVTDSSGLEGRDTVMFISTLVFEGDDTTVRLNSDGTYFVVQSDSLNPSPNGDDNPIDTPVSFQASYSLGTSSSSVSEGSSATFTLSTNNVTAGTAVTYTVSGVSSLDIVGGVMSGSVNVGSNGQATISIPLAADNLTEGTETLTVTAEGQSSSVSVEDTSRSQLTSVSGNSQLSSDGMEVSLVSVTVADQGNNYTQYTFTYTETNNKTERLSQDSFSLVLNDGSIEPQYGFFNWVYPGETTTRTWTASILSSLTPVSLEYAKGFSWEQGAQSEVVWIYEDGVFSIPLNTMPAQPETLDPSSGNDGDLIPAESPSSTHSLDVIVDLLGNVMLLKGLSETISGDLHTVEYNGISFDWSEVDSFVMPVVRDSEFTDEFSQEIADAYPSVAGISYKAAVAFIGTSSLDDVLLMVAGADGSYVS